MKVLFIADVSLEKILGGAERVLHEQAIGLQRRGHEVWVMTRRLPAHETKEGKIQGVRELRYKVNTANPAAFLLTTLFNGPRLFWRLRTKERFDVINAHQPFSAWAALAGGLKDRPFVYTCHSLSFEEYLSRRRAGSVRLRFFDMANVYLRKRIEKALLLEAARIVVLSSFTRDKLQEVYGIDGRRVEIIPGGVDLGRFRPASPEERTTLRRRLRLPTDRLVLLTVRNLVPRMGLENLIAAMKDVSAAVPESFLVIGGTGPLREALISQRDATGLKDRIVFPGFVPEEDLPDLYRCADLFILPTVELEGFGLVTLEALASGTPVLGTPVGGTREILSAFDHSWILKDTTPAALTEGIVSKAQDFLSMPGQRESIAEKCRLFVEQHYSWERNVGRLEEVLEDVRHLRKDRSNG